MLILIEKDVATRIPRECTEDEARALMAQGFKIHVVGDDGNTSELAEAPAGEPSDDAPAKKGRKG